MPIIQVEMLKGRTIEQKREMEFENFSEGGVLRCDKQK